ncbi:MAG TPA: PfkB family carbohydrate kinase [Mariprofundaceae bacterium]|nr:PfkB family carbohydrate kinase [Mariprofundaceae bacterium]
MLDVLCVGHTSFDVTMSVTHQPANNEKMRAEAMQLAGGGPAANASVCVARLGGRAAFLGYLGNDVFGDLHVAELLAEGVDASLVVRGAYDSAVSQVLAKPDGSRSVVSCRGQAPWLESGSVDWRHLEPKVVLFDGHEPLISAEIMLWAKEKGIPTVLDAGSVHRGTRELATQVDCLAASERFAHDWCNTEDMAQALSELAGMAPMAMITCGENGLLWSRDGQRGHLPAFSVEVVDSTGAGDAFHGALAYGMAQNLEWNALLRFASAVGALTCTRLGARASLPHRDAVDHLLG